MDELSVALGTSGAGELIEACEGQTFHIVPPNFRIQSNFIAGFKLKLKRELLEQKRYLTASQAAEDYAMLSSGFAAGHYSWLSPAFVTYVGGEGANHLILLMLRENHSEMTPEMVLAIAESAPEQLAWAYQACLHAADPNHFSLPGTTDAEGNRIPTPRPAGVRPATDLLPPKRNGIPETDATKQTIPV